MEKYCKRCKTVHFRCHGFKGLKLCQCDSDGGSELITPMPRFMKLLKLATPQHDEMPIEAELMLVKIAG